MDEQQRNRMLDLARKTIHAELAERPLPPLAPFGCQDVQHAGGFVTLKNRGRLRGCIGTFSPHGTLPQTIQEMAVTATHDPRFFSDPVTADELDQLQIEVSVLSPLQRVTDPLCLELGKHGIYMKRGAASGCFLPQVATEQQWDKQTFLSQCCQGKAGLPPNAWKDPATEVYLFTAEVFGERHKA